MKKFLIILIVCFCIILSGCLTMPSINNKSDNSTNSSIEPVTSSDAEIAHTPTNSPEQKSQIDISQNKKERIIVIDPGHGKSSSLMTDDEKAQSGFTYIEGKGWGEWRHFKSGTMWQDCEGAGCTGRVPSNGSCWYPIGYGDRDTEPDINYNNALSTKFHLENLGYTVRLTRSPNENPALSKRLECCYPNNDISLEPDADAYVCLHSNAGGGSGSCYISLSGLYDQANVTDTYVTDGNEMGKYINNSIIENTPLGANGNGRYDGYPELVIFCKSPVPVAYMEIGFYDNPNDLAILQTKNDEIGKAIAQGIHSYFTNKQQKN